MIAHTSLQTGQVGRAGFLFTHSRIDSYSKTWKQVVTAAVMGEISSVVMAQVSLDLEESSAISQAMRCGMGLRIILKMGGGCC